MILNIINGTTLNERKPRASGDDPMIRGFGGTACE